MRDKDYRGQNKDKKWCFGSLLTTEFGSLILSDDVSLEVKLNNEEPGYFEFNKFDYVHPETIGEFVTCNKEGQRLYTDDLFRYRLGHIVQLIWDEKESRYIGQAVGYLNTHFSMGLVKEMKLIGNIHDNPDILSPNYSGKKTNLIIYDEIKTNEEEK